MGFPQHIPDPFTSGGVQIMAKTQTTSETVKRTTATERLFDADGVLRYAAGDTIPQDDNTRLYTQAQLAGKNTGE
jgi:hypothetical protein